jgi:O-antigen ligase
MTIVEFRPKVRRRWFERADVAMLSTLVVLLVAIPSILIFGPLGAAGTPADVLGLLLLLIWAFRAISLSEFAKSRSTVRVALLLFVASVLVSYVAATTRPIESLELNGADRAVLSALAWLGIAMFMIDGPKGFGDLETILRRLTIAGAAEAAVGIAQFVTHMPLVNYIQIPGLTANSSLVAMISSRGNQTRPPGTTIHPIEFGAVLTMILPLALYFALNDQHRTRMARWAPVFLISFAIPMSISRTAVISAAVALLFVVPTWPVAVRRRGYVAMVGMIGCVYVAVPGLLGTIRNLFTGISSDSSAASRTGSYELAGSLIARAPLFGRGYGTFLPEYRILDNQVLLTTVEAGFIGVVALFVVLVAPVVTGVKIRRASSDPHIRQLAQSLAAGVAAAGCSFAFYDALAFPMATGILFMLIGAIGCLARLARVHPHLELAH